CPHAGVVKKLHIKKGDTVQVGSLLATIEAEGEEPAAAEAPQAAAPQEEAKPQPAPEPQREAPQAAPAAVAAPQPQPAVGGDRQGQVQTAMAALDEALETDVPPAASPDTRRYARE